MANPVPEITFRVNLELLDTEQIGPNTNAVNPHMLHPTRHQDSQDNALVELQEHSFYLEAGSISGI
jgi:hypothetical protein